MRPLRPTPRRLAMAEAAHERALARAAADRERHLRERLEDLRQRLAHAQQEVVYLREQNAILRARVAHLARRKQRQPTAAAFEKYRRQRQKKASVEFLRRAYALRQENARKWGFSKA